MFSLFVGIILLIILLSVLWIGLGKIGAFDFAYKLLIKLSNIFKEEKK